MFGLPKKIICPNNGKKFSHYIYLHLIQNCWRLFRFFYVFETELKAIEIYQSTIYIDNVFSCLYFSMSFSIFECLQFSMRIPKNFLNVIYIVCMTCSKLSRFFTILKLNEIF